MKLKFLTIVFFLWTANSLSGQNSTELLKEKLVNTGFENIRVHGQGNEYTISFENNIYRYNVRALSTALDTIVKYTPENTSLNIIQLQLNIPQIVTKVNSSEWYKFRNDTIPDKEIESSLSVSYQTKNTWNKIKSTRPLNRNIARFDFVFYPQLYMTNLTWDQIYEVQFNIAPALEVSFWKGSLFTAQLIIPIYSEYKVYGKEGKTIRPGFIVLSQNFRLPGPWFGNVSIGNFNFHRYGIDANIVYPFKNPRWHIGLNAGLTGSSALTENGWEIGNPNTFTFSINAGYFLPRFDLRFDVKAGKFLRGDYGGRFDLTRMFGESAIGFYATYTVDEIDGSGHPNAGFHLSVPFPPGKRFKHKRLRANVPRYFDWEYNGATDFLYNRYYETRPNENRSEHFFNPIYIKNELLKNRHYK